MKKKYGKPESKFVVFDVRDIVVTSGEDESVSAETPVYETFDPDELCQ